MKRLGATLRAARGEKPLRAAAREIGISHVYLRGIERGEIIPSRAMLELLAKAYGAAMPALEAAAVHEIKERAAARWRRSGES